MGKWSAFLVSLIPAGLAGYLCYLLITIGLSIPDDKMGMMFWGPLGAGFLGCVMAVLTPFGIAIFIRSSSYRPTAGTDLDTSEDSLEGEDEFGGHEFSEEDLSSSDFDSDDELLEDESSSQFQTAEFSSDEFDDDDFSDDFDTDFGDEFDSIEDNEEDRLA